MDLPVDFVLFWAPEEDGKIQGGTATAVNLARKMEIPVFNLADDWTEHRWSVLNGLREHRKQRMWITLLEWFASKEKR